MTTNVIALMNLTFLMLSVNKRPKCCALKFKQVTAESNDFILGNKSNYDIHFYKEESL